MISNNAKEAIKTIAITITTVALTFLTTALIVEIWIKKLIT